MLAKLSVKKPLLIVVIVLIVIALGVVSYLNTSVDLLPEMDLPFIVIVTIFPGAVPDVVEKELTTPIESVVAKVSGIKNMTSTSAEHFSMITLELSSSANTMEVKQDIESGLKLASLPSDPLRQEPIIIEISASLLPMMTMSIGVKDEAIENVSDYLEEIVSRITAVDGVASASVNGLVSNLVLMNLNGRKTAEAFLDGTTGHFGIDFKLSESQKESIRLRLQKIVNDAKEDESLSTDGEIDSAKLLDKLIEEIENGQGSDGTSEENLLMSLIIPELKKEDSEFRQTIIEMIELILENEFMLEDGEENKQIFGDILDQAFESGVSNLVYGYTRSMLSAINAEILSTIIMAQDFDMPAGNIKEGATSFIVKIGSNVNSREEFMTTAAVSIDIGNIVRDYMVRIEAILTILSYTAEDGIYNITDSNIRTISEELARTAEEIEDYAQWVIDNVTSESRFSNTYMSEGAKEDWKELIEENLDFIALMEEYSDDLPRDYRTKLLKLIRDSGIYLEDDKVIAEAMLWTQDYTDYYIERISEELENSRDGRVVLEDYETEEEYKMAFAIQVSDYVINTANTFSVFNYALTAEQFSEWRELIKGNTDLINELVGLDEDTHWQKFVLDYVVKNEVYPSTDWTLFYTNYYKSSFNATLTTSNAGRPSNPEGYASWGINRLANRIPNSNYYLRGSFVDAWVAALENDAEFIVLTEGITDIDNWQHKVFSFMNENSHLTSVIPVGSTVTAERLWSVYKPFFLTSFETSIARWTVFENRTEAIRESIGEDAFDSYIRMLSGRSEEDIYKTITAFIEVLEEHGGEGAVVVTIDQDTDEKSYAIDVNIIKETIKDATDNLTVDLKIGDIADMIFLNNSSKLITRLMVNDGEGNFSSSPSVVISIEKEADASTVDVSAGIKDLLKIVSSERADFTYNIISDDGDMIGFMLNTVLESLLWGAVLAVFVLLVFFKRIKPTLSVGISILFSVVFTFVLMYFSGITLNIVSMGGLTLGVGMLVDNSIVVLENIQRLRLQGKTRFEAAIQGAKQMSSAIFASTLTTIVVFLPILFISGLVKEIMSDMALTVCFSLLASLFVALTVIPISSAYIMKETPKGDSKILRGIKKGYVRSLNFSLNNKWLILSIAMILFVSMTLAGFMISKTEIFPKTYMGSVSVGFNINKDAIDDRNFGLTVMDENYLTYEDIEAEIVEKALVVFDRYPDVSAAAIYVSAGMNMGGFAIGGGNLSATLSLVSEKERTMDPFDLCDDIENSLNYEGGNLFSVDVSVSSIMSFAGSLSDAEYNIYVYGRDYDLMIKEADKIADILSTSEKITSVRKNVDTAAEEFKLIVDKDAASKYGLTTGQVYLQISEAIKEVSSSHILRLYSDETRTIKTNYDVMIYSEDYVNTSWYLGSKNEKPTKVFINNNHDYEGINNEYFIRNAKGTSLFVKDEGEVKVIPTNGNIPVHLKDGQFEYSYAVVTKNEETALHDVEYVTENILMTDKTQFYSVKRADIDLISLTIKGSDILGTGAQTKNVPLYKLLSPESFEKDAEGNILYRTGLLEDVPASLVKTSGYTGIRHIAGRKVISLKIEYSAKYSEKEVVGDINNLIAGYNQDKPATITVDTTKATSIMDEVMNNLYLILGAAIILIFLIMVAQFQSWKKPFIVMFTVPLAFTGSFALMLLSATSINIMSLIGIIILMGVVVNNGIVFVDYADKVIEAGTDKREALLRTGVDRLRPILLTALTTICALIIMASDRTDYGLLLAPIAIAMVGGLTYATFVTLYIVPIAYDILNKKYKVSEEFKALKDANIDKIDDDNIFEEVDTYYAEQIVLESNMSRESLFAKLLYSLKQQKTNRGKTEKASKKALKKESGKNFEEGRENYSTKTSHKGSSKNLEDNIEKYSTEVSREASEDGSKEISEEAGKIYDLEASTFVSIDSLDYIIPIDPKEDNQDATSVLNIDEVDYVAPTPKDKEDQKDD